MVNDQILSTINTFRVRPLSDIIDMVIVLYVSDLIGVFFVKMSLIHVGKLAIAQTEQMTCLLFCEQKSYTVVDCHLCERKICFFHVCSLIVFTANNVLFHFR